MIINPQDFVHEVPDLHPLSLDYQTYWREAKNRSIEGHWLGGYYMPPGLYFYTNYGTILLNKKRSNVKSIGRPWLRDLEWMFFRAWLEARGFSGFKDDEEYSGNFALLDPDNDDEYLRYNYPDVFNSDNIKKEFRHPRTLLEMHHPYHKGVPLYENEAHNLLMLGSRDTGKAISIDTDLPTLTGSIKMRDISVGDKILSIDGQETAVLGVYPQGLRTGYRLIFSDGRELEVDKDHINTFYDINKRGLVNLTTSEILDNYKYAHKRSGHTYRFSLPQIDPINYPEKTFKLPPYLVGVLIGDGTITTLTPKIATEDLEILDHIRDVTPGVFFKKDPTNCNYTIRVAKEFYNLYGVKNKSQNPIRQELVKLGLNVTCKDKFIPEQYLFSSYAQRLELLRGLLDTDGSVTKSGNIEFISSNSKLSGQVVTLCRSLGIRCQLGTSKGTGYSKEPYYRVYINTSIPVFKLKRKLERLKTKRIPKVSLIDIKCIGEIETQCIKVDHPSSLFLATKDYIPTHNTYMVGIGVVLHQWLFNGRVYTDEDVSNRGVADITVGAELAHYSTNMLVKTKFALENLPGTKTVNGRRYPAPFEQQYKGAWSAGSIITAEYKQRAPGGWEPKGSRATIRHRTFKDNPFAEQGTRPIAIIVEEAGHCSNLMDIYTNTKDNLRSGLRKTGTLMMLGTGGDMESGTLDASRMFYEPEAHDILAFEDTWENKGRIGFFIPAYLALNEYKDEQGFSRIEEARTALLKKRQKAKTGSGGSEVLNKEIQYRPIVPSEMFLSKSANIFPVTEARRRLSELQTNNLSELLEKKVNLFFDPASPYNGVNYEIDFNLNPINRFPWDSDDVEGAPIIYEFPYLDNGQTPQDAYIIGCDPFRDNTGMSGSFAAIYVMKTNKYPSTVGHNEIVATYIGRPYEGVNKVNELLYKLSLFYGNAKIYFENAVGNVKDYFERIKRLDLLAKQPVNVLNRKASFNTTETLIYGYPMSNEKIKWEALQYVRSWLLQERQDNVRNIDVIPDKFLLQQLISFTLDGNFDGVMGLIGCVIGLEEIYISSKRKAENESTLSSLDNEFNKLLVNNKRLFYNTNEKFSKAKTVVQGEDQRWLSMV